MSEVDSNLLRNEAHNGSVKNALLVLPEPPLPFGGAAARWYHALLKGLGDRDIVTTILACSGGKDRDAEAMDLHGRTHKLSFFESTKRVVTSPFWSFLSPFSYPYSVEMRNSLYNLPLQDFQLIQFETQFTGWLVNRTIPGAVVNILNLYCIDWHNSFCSTFRQRAFRSRVLKAEKKLIRRFGRFSALSERLSLKTKALHPRGIGKVTPLTIDLSLYPLERSESRWHTSEFTVGLIGSFNWTPTLSAGNKLIKDIWPRLKGIIPNLKLLLVGRNAGAVFGKGYSGLEIHSDVDDTLPFFHRIDTMVYLPSIGSGMKIKVLEAIALGVPVVTNSEGAEGLPLSVASKITVDSELQAIDRIVRFANNGTHAHEHAAQVRWLLMQDLSLDDCVDRTISCNKK